MFNRLLWATPDGELRHYDKRHLFRMAKEHERYAAGRDRLTVELKGWRVCPLVCYDLRFPVFSATVSASKRPDGSTTTCWCSWPTGRVLAGIAWQTLLRARAIENLCYVAAVNRVGIDGNDFHYSGDSVALDELGRPLLECGAQVQVATVRFSAEALARHRENFPAQLDADSFELRD